MNPDFPRRSWELPDEDDQFYPGVAMMGAYAGFYREPPMPEVPASLVECTLLDLATYLAREEGR